MSTVSRKMLSNCQQGWQSCHAWVGARNTNKLNLPPVRSPCLRHVHKHQHVQSSGAYCVDLVRKYDYENYLATLLYPAEWRSSAFAIRALNVEIAQVRDVVSEKQIALMRMLFWKEALDAIYKGSPRQTPVSIEMAKAVSKHKLSKHWITRIIEGRTENLSDAPFKNRQQMEQYSENTVSSVLYLLLELAGVKNVQADHAASHIGKAQGIVTLLRATPFNASKGRVYLPLDVIMENNVSQQSFIRGHHEQPVKDVVYEIASIANRHLETAHSMKTEVPKEALPVFYCTVMCEQYLKMIQAVDFDVFHPKLQQRNNLLPLQLWLRKMKKTF